MLFDSTIPRAPSSPGRRAFVAIDPVTETYHHLPEPGLGGLRSLVGARRRPTYFAISYVWDEWKEKPSDTVPSWDYIRGRLLKLSTTRISAPTNGSNATLSDLSNDPRALIAPDSVPDVFHCWVDCKCIDQSSPADKAYWIPRMNKVFFHAKCTILLLRNFDLTAVWELHANTKCTLSQQEAGSNGWWGGAESRASSHQCIFSPGCLRLRMPMNGEVENLAVSTLESLWNSPWRKRAWIFQEILLSEKYLLSWAEDSRSLIAYMDLEQVGLVAAWLHHRRPSLLWLADFWTWCKQCLLLRRFYSAGCDIEATIFQLADNLEATIPCDKYYALCGILNLGDITYSPIDTADQALDKMVTALTKQGRMGWLYSIPPSVREGIVFSSQHMAPFVLTRKKRQPQLTMKLRESFFSTTLFGLTSIPLGKVNSELGLDDLLSQLRSLKTAIDQTARGISRRLDILRDHFTTADFIHRRFHGFLFRLGYDVIAPLCDPRLLTILFRALDRSGLNLSLLQTDMECCLWYTTIALCFISPSEVAMTEGPEVQALVRVSAESIQGLCSKLRRQNWKLLQWRRSSTNHSRDHGYSEPGLVAFNGHIATLGKTMWSVHAKQSSYSLLFVANELEPSGPQLGSASDYMPTPTMMIKMTTEERMRFGAEGQGRSEYTDQAQCFLGVAYQISSSPLSVQPSSIYHDDAEDSANIGFWRLRLPGQGSPRKAVFLSFQRRSYSDAPPDQYLTSSYSMLPPSTTTRTRYTGSSYMYSPDSETAPSTARAQRREPTGGGWPERARSELDLLFPMLEPHGTTPNPVMEIQSVTASSRSGPSIRVAQPASGYSAALPRVSAPPTDPYRIYEGDTPFSGLGSASSHSPSPNQVFELDTTQAPVGQEGSAAGPATENEGRCVEWDSDLAAQDIPSPTELLEMFPALRMEDVSLVLGNNGDLDQVLNTCLTLQNALSQRGETPAPPSG
ncbi:hypothetical protein B0T18DRAFT_400589 [Schizothecium vesticola]|uniref:Heterokaryon incompatibility domain-containing protein n=1 Tax=Schizothecium vesticola TaxID=314040 RepID=A0AA40FC31_9PEZI|nr:hypothetical protein B0T18DRAFT_400589 [Schizothecium vesticola]